MYSFTTTAARFIWIESVSRPKPSVMGRRPTLRRICEVGRTSVFPSFVSMLTPSADTAVTFVSR